MDEIISRRAAIETMTETDGFKVFDFSISQPYFTVTENGIVFSKGVAQHLGFPRFAQLLINESEKRIMLRPCSAGEHGAHQFFKAGKTVQSVRWNPGRLIATVSGLMGADVKKAGFRVEGEAQRQNCVVFDLNKAKELR